MFFFWESGERLGDSPVHFSNLLGKQNYNESGKSCRVIGDAWDVKPHQLSPKQAGTESLGFLAESDSEMVGYGLESG